MNSFVVILIILLPLLANSFGFVTARRTALQQKLANHQYAKPLQHSLQMKNDFSITKAFGVGIISFGLTGLPVALLSSQPPALVQIANADVRAAQKRTYFRFVPKFKTGRDYYKNELKAAIDKGDWDTVKKFFEEYASKVNPEADVIFTDSYVNNNYYRPMKVLAGSFAERAVSAKQTALVEQEVAFEGAMKGLLNCVQDLPGEGFFAAPIKMPTGAARTKLAQESWAKGKEAINNYIKIFNNGLMMELNKLEPME